MSTVWSIGIWSALISQLACAYFIFFGLEIGRVYKIRNYKDSYLLAWGRIAENKVVAKILTIVNDILTIVAACLTSALTITYNFGVAVVPMTAELKMSMTVATACYSGSTLLQALMAPLMGHYIEKRGVRSTMMLGTAFLVIGCIILGCARGILTYFIGWLPFVAVGQRFGAMAPSQISIANWFYRKRGLATALFFTSGGVAGFIFMPLMTEIAERFSWRHTWFTIGKNGIKSMLHV